LLLAALLFIYLPENDVSRLPPGFRFVYEACGVLPVIHSGTTTIASTECGGLPGARRRTAASRPARRLVAR
jgi:hypothetical protein